MALWLLIFAGAVRWLAKMQYREAPRALLNWICVAALGYAGWIIYFEPERAWQVRWAGRAILDTILRALDVLIP